MDQVLLLSTSKYPVPEQEDPESLSEKWAGNVGEWNSAFRTKQCSKLKYYWMILCCTELSKFHLVGWQFSFFVDYGNFQESKFFHRKYGNHISLQTWKPGSKVRHTCFSYWLQFRSKKIGNPLKPPHPQTSLAVLWN